MPHTNCVHRSRGCGRPQKWRSSARRATPIQIGRVHDRSSDLIEDAFRHVTQFTADASHELRTPLAVMRATAEVALLRATGNADSYREALHRILSEAERNTILLDNMLHLARADSGTWALELRPADLGRNLGRACGRVEWRAREKNIALRVEIADEPLCIAADADHLLRLCLIL